MDYEQILFKLSNAMVFKLLRKEARRSDFRGAILFKIRHTQVSHVRVLPSLAQDGVRIKYHMVQSQSMHT